MFLHHPLIMGYNSRKFGMTLSGRNYIMCRSILAAASLGEAAGMTLSGRNYIMYRSILAAASLGEAAGLTPVSMRQVKSKDVPCSDD